MYTFPTHLQTVVYVVLVSKNPKTKTKNPSEDRRKKGDIHPNLFASVKDFIIFFYHRKPLTFWVK